MLMNHQVWKDVERAADWGGLIIWGPTLSTASFLMKKTESYVPSTQPLEAGTHILLCVCVFLFSISGHALEIKYTSVT